MTVAQLLLPVLQQMLITPDFSVLSKPSFHLKFSEHFPCPLHPTPQILFSVSVWILLHTRQLPNVGDTVENVSNVGSLHPALQSHGRYM